MKRTEHETTIAVSLLDYPSKEGETLFARAKRILSELGHSDAVIYDVRMDVEVIDTSTCGGGKKSIGGDETASITCYIPDLIKATS